MIEDLTDEQRELLKVYRDKWLKIGLSTETMDREKAYEAVCLAYECAGFTPPKLVYYEDSPFAGLDRVNDLLGNKKKEWVSPCYGNHHASWLSLYEFFYDQFGLGKEIRGQIAAAKQCCWWWPLDEAVVITDRPAEIHLDENNRLHNENGMAIRYRDNKGYYVWHNIRIPAWVIENPEKITAEKILKERNVEVRRAIIEKWGYDNFVTNLKPDLVHEDIDILGKPRKLWRKELPEDTLMLCEVINSTPEPDGTYKKYFLAVHSELRPMGDSGNLGNAQELTCHNAVASTFGLYGDAYNPIRES